MVKPALALIGCFALAASLLTATTPALAVGGLVSSVRVAGGVLIVEGSSKSETQYVMLDRNAGVVVYRVSTALKTNGFASAITPGAGCTQSFSADAAICPAAGLTRIDVMLYDGDDTLVTGMSAWSPDMLPAQVPMRIFGGNGGDDLRGGLLGDEIYGEAGIDRLLGDEGPDTLDGGPQDDTLTGDSSNGAIMTTDQISADAIYGGTGIDTLIEERGMGRVQFWLLDNVANDGADTDDDLTNGAEEGDNIHSDVENVTTSFDDDRVAGSASANTIVTNGGSDIVLGFAGDDDIRVGFAATEYVDAGVGDDTIMGSGTLIGGTGADTIYGTDGNERITPGSGGDTVLAYGGNDLINSADGAVDQINCGAGADIATTDTGDVLSSRRGELCELVMGPIGNPRFTAARATMRVAAPGRGTLTTTVTAGRVVLGTARTAVAGAGTLTITVPWNRAGRTKASGRTIGATVKLTFAGARGNPSATTTRVVTLRR